MKTLLKTITAAAGGEVVRSLEKKEKRTKQIRITQRTYEDLIKLGNMAEDFEDVIARLLKYYKENERDKRS